MKFLKTKSNYFQIKFASVQLQALLHLEATFLLNKQSISFMKLILMVCIQSIQYRKWGLSPNSCLRLGLGKNSV